MRARGALSHQLAPWVSQKGFKVKALCRNREKAATVLGESPNLELVVGDCRDAATLKGVGEGCSSVVCVTGTTAFPSARWKDGNGPEATDYTGNVHLIDEIKRTNPDLKRFVFVSSIG
jgi:nucleoside-diphosphate-sugar epimerase